jgi:hypothetical protein
MATIFRNQKLFCTNCGGEFTLQYPVAVDQMIEKIKLFEELHNDCKKTYTETVPKPVQNHNYNVMMKALWWMSYGEKGNSSITMWNCFMGKKGFPVHHPYDPDDFKRCYKLLQVIPEWKIELHKLKQLSKEWSNLVDNWDKLTEMYEENVITNWKEYKRIGMYEFMQTLINPK